MTPIITIAALELELERRSLCMTIGPRDSDEPWLVELYAEDDPELGMFEGEGETLEAAIVVALAHWDKGQVAEIVHTVSDDGKLLGSALPGDDGRASIFRGFVAGALTAAAFEYGAKMAAAAAKKKKKADG